MQTFKKEERLSNRKKIDELFSNGKSFYISPIRVIWLKSVPGSIYPAQVLISVSRRQFKKAVDRNLIKRRIREAYRKNKVSFYHFLDEQNTGIVFALVYSSAVAADYKEIEKKIIFVLQRLQSEYEKDSG
ncbi:MAG: ribonuclease P protein component [Bacteroidales bacterium]|nr:ribonuclease P protein component [Bacteroidales bacterium]